MESKHIIYIIIAILAIGFVACMITSWFLIKRNDAERKNNNLFPFSGRLAPSGIWNPSKNSSNPGLSQTPEEGLYFTGMNGGVDDITPQIICPPDSKINIVAAYLEVIDPYGECSNTPDPTLQRTCGYNPQEENSTAITCNKRSDCGSGMICSPDKKCIPQQCSSNTNCFSTNSNIKACNPKLGTCCNSIRDEEDGLKCVTSDVIDGCDHIWVADPGKEDCLACIDPETGLPPTGNNGFCSTMPTCMLVDKGLNQTCSPSLEDDISSNKCRPRDASAYLSEYCNGKNICLGTKEDTWLPNATSNPFGPLPCKIPANSEDSNYLSLPIISGWAGGNPPGGKGKAKPSFSQGYYAHGIYQCLPKDS